MKANCRCGQPRDNPPDYYCRSCRNAHSRKVGEKRRKEKPFDMYVIRKRGECKKKGLPFDLDVEYLKSIWTGVCPVFGTPISFGVGRNDSRVANLDRTDPELGYTKGNVVFLSGRANRLKNNVTVEELELLYKYMKEM